MKPPLARGWMRGTVSRLFATALMSAALLWPAQPAMAQFQQFGNKLVGTGAVGSASQGFSVALSGDGSTAIVGGPNDNSNLGAAWVFRRGASWIQEQKLVGGNNVGGAEEGRSVALSVDGNTAIVGGYKDNNDAGAAWVFTRSSGVWTQQGNKLIGSGAVGAAQQGVSVALSADGNTAIVGGWFDNGTVGAAWVFTRSGGTWSQLGGKLVGAGAVGNARQGRSVALSSDGNTAILGAPLDNSNAGAVWVFTRSGGVWSEQTKLLGTGGGGAQQGTSVALSGDGNTAIVGGYSDNNFVGAAWVFTRSGGVWSQQGGKLVGAGATGPADQGVSVALSADGNTAIVGGFGDNSNAGAAWVFTRSGGTWSQLGGKLVGSGAVGGADQGFSVALSGDANMAIVGGYFDNVSGAAWTFYRTPGKLNPAATHNFLGGFYSSVAWRQNGGATATWETADGTTVQPFNLGTVPTNWQMVGQRDFNNDGIYDFLWRDGASGTVAIWLWNGSSVQQSGTVGAVALNWSIAGTSDFDYDGKGDILWRDSSSGTVAIWLMNGLSIINSRSLGTVPLNWTIAATDGKGNIFWRDTGSGTLAIWEVYGFEVLRTATLGTVPLNWTIAGVGDFDGNGSTDILWRDSNTGTLAIWLMNGFSVLQTGTLGAVPSNWIVTETGDFNNDHKSDILWRDTSAGTVAIWLMNGLQIATSGPIATVGLDWTIQGLNAD